MTILFEPGEVHVLMSEQTLAGITCRNIFHFSVIDANTPDEPIEDVMEHWCETKLDAITATQITAVVGVKTSWRNLSVPSQGLFERNNTVAGQISVSGNGGLPGFMAMGWRLTGQLGLARSGWKRFVGLGKSDVTNDMITPRVGGDLETAIPLLAAQLVSDFVTDGNNVLRPTIWSKKGFGTPPNHTQYITQADFRYLISTQNSRKATVGE